MHAIRTAPAPIAAPLGARPRPSPWLQRLRAWLAEGDELAALNQRDLRDIGLTPYEARMLGREPFPRDLR